MLSTAHHGVHPPGDQFRLARGSTPSGTPWVPVRQATDGGLCRGDHALPPDPIATMMANPWIALTVLCVGTLISLPHRQPPATALALHSPDPARMLNPADATALMPGARLQDLSDRPERQHLLQWAVQAPDEDGMASLQARSSDSLAGMTWILPGGIRALHLREGQAELIEEPGHWRVVAGDVHRLAVHWQQRSPAESALN